MKAFLEIVELKDQILTASLECADPEIPEEFGGNAPNDCGGAVM